VTASTLVFAWGNPARGDDALGPLFAEAIEALHLPDVDCLTDFQLQVEHALDLQGRQRVLFVDASLGAPAPFGVQTLAPLHDESFSSHAMSPAAVLQVYCDVLKRPPPPAQLLAIQGVQWELGIAPSNTARENLAAALAWAKHWLTSDTAAGTAQAPT
jgi:hydrogenase maturation protease